MKTQILAAIGELQLQPMASLNVRQCRIGGKLLSEGDSLSLDGDTGAVYPGRLAALTDHPTTALAAIALWMPAAAA